MDVAAATTRPAARAAVVVGCAAIAAAGLLVGLMVAFVGPMTFRPLGWRVQIGDALRPLALAAIADIALFALASRRRSWRLGAGLLLAIIVAVSLLAAARRAPPTYPVSDEALIELATLAALDGDQLHGPYSRYGWHHPGPLLFYLLAPFYAAAGLRTSGLAAGALAINVAALTAAVWVLLRRAGPALTISVCTLIALYLAGLPGLLVSWWNPHTTIVASIALVVASAAVAAGDARLLPLLALLASFVVQTHIATLPLVGVTTGSAVAMMGRRFVAASIDERGLLKAQVNRAAWLTGVLWLLPLVEELSRPAGNMSLMWQFARQPAREGDLLQAFDVWARMFTGVFRSGFSIPMGRLLAHDATLSSPVIAVLQLLLLVGVAVWAGRQGRKLHAWMAVQSLAASAGALWALTRIPEGIHDHEAFWISAIGVVAAATIAAAAGGAASERWQTVRSWTPSVAAVAVAVLLTGVSLEGLRQMAADASSRAKRADETVMRATRAIQAEIQRLGADRPMVLIDQRVWDAAAGVILQLRKQGIRVAIERGLVRMFAGTLTPDGTEDVEISFCGGPCHERLISRPENIVVLLTKHIAIDALPLRR